MDPGLEEVGGTRSLKWFAQLRKSPGVLWGRPLKSPRLERNIVYRESLGVEYRMHMDLTGFYTVLFHGPAGSGAGVISIDDELKARGGDSGFRYTGIVVEEGGGEFRIDLDVVQNYAHGGGSVFGPLTNFALTLRGTMVGDKLQCSGHVEGAFSAVATRVDV